LKRRQVLCYHGNPHGDPWDPEMVLEWARCINKMGIRVIHLSDIMEDITPERIRVVYDLLISSLPEIEFGLHLHITWKLSVTSHF
jgi:hydroxymethylglutaryl-CoA lyase